MVLLPNVIFVRRGVEVTVELISHELVHVVQIRRYGLLGYWSRYLWLLAAHGWGNHPMEVEAHERAHEYVIEAQTIIDQN